MEDPRVAGEPNANCSCSIRSRRPCPRHPQILGGFFLLAGLYFTWRSLEVAREGQVTERFTRAIDQLGAIDEKSNPKLEIRLGGIYALERIARDSERDHWPIMEILTAYIRKRAELPEGENGKPDYASEDPAAADVQAALTVLGRRVRTFGEGEYQELNLRITNLFGADLREARLRGANFTMANLRHTILWLADLRDAVLTDARLEDAYLPGADLQGAHLMGAILERACLQGVKLGAANLQGAKLGAANLQGAILVRTNLQHANLIIANLQGANLAGANLQGAELFNADLRGAYLYKANLRGANLLTQGQVDSAIGDETTQLPEGIATPESWRKPG